MTQAALVRHSPVHLVPDPRRVITRPFHPGEEAQLQGISRAEAVLERVLAMPEAEVTATVDGVLASFAGRHEDLRATFREHVEFVAHRLPSGALDQGLTQDRMDLIGACLTHEYSVEAAALCNPSIVAHPTQDGCAEGELRFVLTLRAVGEGHVSSLEFRTGVLGADAEVRIDEPSRCLVTGRTTDLAMSVDFLRDSLDQHGDAVAAESVLRLLPSTFTPVDLDAVLASNALDSPGRERSDGLLARIRRTAASSYRRSFAEHDELSARVIVPHSQAESHGIEDVRLVSFTDEDGVVDYVGTYTAFDGLHVAPHSIRTRDFLTFDVAPMIGAAAQNKGMALFPRRIDGDVWSLSRWDRENISVTRSRDGQRWDAPEVVLTPRHPWDVIQLGACSSPIETSAGWLVLTHGVGPMRVYSIGAVLLALDDPTRVVGALDSPLLTPSAADRDGYVPNVVYTCGAIAHGDVVVMPYGCADASIRFAVIDLPGLLAALCATPGRTASSTRVGRP